MKPRKKSRETEFYNGAPVFYAVAAYKHARNTIAGQAFREFRPLHVPFISEQLLEIGDAK